MSDLYGVPRTKADIAADPQPGDLYRTSWGYDQTNVEYFEVVKRTPGTVTLRRIAARMGREEWGENPRSVYPAPGSYIRDRLMDGNPPWTGSSGTHYPNPRFEKAERDGYSEKVCRLATKPRKWQTDGKPSMGAYLTIDEVRSAWPYESGGAYDTIAAGDPGH